MIPQEAESIAQIDCAQALEGIQGGGGQQHAELRVHMAACEACQELYEAHVRTLARLGRKQRTTRLATEKAHRHQALRRDVFDVQSPKRLLNGRLRTLAYPAFFAFLMLMLAGRLPLNVGAHVQAQGPDVWVRGHVLTPEAGQARLRRGEVLHIGQLGSAVLHTGKTTWTMDGACDLRLERLSKPTVRLAQGSLELAGTGRCLTSHGILTTQAESRVRLEMTPSGLQVQVQEGTATLLSADGEWVLGPGDALVRPLANCGADS